MEWPWDALGLILATTWLPLGCPWALWGSLGIPWGSLGVTLGVPWGALGSLGGALGCSGRFYWICQNLDLQFRANVSKLVHLRIEYSLPECSPGSSGSSGASGSGIWPQFATPLPRAGGQDDVSLKETPSNYVIGRFRYLHIFLCHFN